MTTTTLTTATAPYAECSLHLHELGGNFFSGDADLSEIDTTASVTRYCEMLRERLVADLPGLTVTFEVQMNAEGSNSSPFIDAPEFEQEQAIRFALEFHSEKLFQSFGWVVNN